MPDNKLCSLKIQKKKQLHEEKAFVERVYTFHTSALRKEGVNIYIFIVCIYMIALPNLQIKLCTTLLHRIDECFEAWITERTVYDEMCAWM